MTTQRIDSHQHFWKFDPIRDSWINDDMKAIRRDFLPADLEPVLKQHGFDGCVVVQSDQSEAENEFQLKHAAAADFVKGVVGWVDLQDENVEERLAYYSAFKAMKGFRHVLQGEADRALMLKPAFKRGIRLLHQHNFTYDILIFPDQLQYATDLVNQFPYQKFVIDHIAKPYIKDGKIDGWRQDIKAIAAHDNVYCKISGMVTEADWNNWKADDFRPYLDTVTEAFGTKRILYGSDWPVCQVAGGYAKMLAVVTDYFSAFTENEQQQFFGANATRFYNL